jgi:hypothetical protein
MVYVLDQGSIILLDEIRWATLALVTILAVFFVFTAIMYRMFLLSRQDITVLDLPGYPFFTYLFLKRGMRPETILNHMSKDKIEKSLSEYDKVFKNTTVRCENKKNAATAIAEYADDHIFRQLYIYWDRKNLKTEYEAELRKNTRTRLEIINKKSLKNYETIGATRYAATNDHAFAAKYATLTNRPQKIGQLTQKFMKQTIKADIDTLTVEGKYVKIKTEHKDNIKDVIELLQEFEKTADELL